MILQSGNSIPCGSDESLCDDGFRVERIRNRVAEATLERLRQDVEERVPEKFRPLFEYVRKHLWDPNLTVERAARESGASARVSSFLGTTLKPYYTAARIETAERMLDDGTVLTSRVAAAVGIPEYSTFRDTYRRLVGRYPRIIRRPPRLAPDFNAVTWAWLVHGELNDDDSVLLAKKLANGLRVFEGLQPIDHARQTARQRVIKDAERLRSRDRSLASLLDFAADNLFEESFSVREAYATTGIQDSSASSRLGYYLGDALADYVGRRQLEVAAWLLGEPGFSLEKIAEAAGISRDSFRRSLIRRTGLTASQIRDAVEKQYKNVQYDTWLRVGRQSASDNDVALVDRLLQSLGCDPLGGTPKLAVRSNVEPKKAREVVELVSVVGPYEEGSQQENPQREIMERVLSTHPDYAAAFWYTHWVRDRLDESDVATAWRRWEDANRNLRQLLRYPESERAEIIRSKSVYQSEAFIWLLTDCVLDRLFVDVAESEHFADLALQAAGTKASTDLFQLALGLKGNALRRRNDFMAAFELLGAALEQEGPCRPWIYGLLTGSYASLLDARGEHSSARLKLCQASAAMKEAGDELERIRFVLNRSSAWLAAGVNSTRLLTLCIQLLERYPFADDLIQGAHLNRVFTSLYLEDRLTGDRLEMVKRYQAELPVASTPIFKAHHQQVDGLLAVFCDEIELATDQLSSAASIFATAHLWGHAAVCSLQLAWATLDSDLERSSKEATTAFDYMLKTGFKSHGLLENARSIYLKAQEGLLSRELLRCGILTAVCPRAAGRWEAVDQLPL